MLPIKEEYHKWHSYYLFREFEMLVFGYGGYPVILFPTSGGRYYQSKDNGFINEVSELVGKGLLKIYCPDSVDFESWYNYSISPSDRVKTHNGYENLIIKEVIDFARHETGREKVGVAGCCFGAYHALNIALRHPDLIDAITCMGGRYDIKPFIWGYYDDNCYFNSPLDYLPGLEDNWYLDKFRTMKINFGLGEKDPYFSENSKISELLLKKGINYNFINVSGAGHELETWKKLFNQFMQSILNSNR